MIRYCAIVTERKSGKVVLKCEFESECVEDAMEKAFELAELFNYDIANYIVKGQEI